jgi:hypothetical protein
MVYSLLYYFQFFLTFAVEVGGLAQLARACDWQSQGREFDSPNLHTNNETVITLSCSCLFYLNPLMNTQVNNQPGASPIFQSFPF